MYIDGKIVPCPRPKSLLREPPQHLDFLKLKDQLVVLAKVAKALGMTDAADWLQRASE